MAPRRLPSWVVSFAALPLACGNSAPAVPGSAGSAGAETAGSSGSSSGGSVGGAGGAAAGTAGEAGSADDCPANTALVTRLSVDGDQILDPNGVAVELRGWNWGQWGSEQAEDAADNAAQGANVVRIPLRWWGFYDNEDQTSDPLTRIDSRSDDAPGHIEPQHLRVLDQMIHDAACHGLWIDLFLDSNCGQASATGGTAAYCGTVASGAPASFANDPEMVEEFSQTWEFLVSRYAKQAFIGMYELLPEPHLGCSASPCDNWSAAPSFYAPLIQRLRALDPLTPFLIGPDGGYEIKQIATAYIPNLTGLVYTGNFLDGPAGHPEYVAYASDFRAQQHVPIFIQQVGSRKDDPDPATRARTILEALNAAGIGWTWWTYRETKSIKGNGFAPFWENGAPPWSEDADWLKTIADRFH